MAALKLVTAPPVPGPTDVATAYSEIMDAINRALDSGAAIEADRPLLKDVHRHLGIVLTRHQHRKPSRPGGAA